MSCHAWRRQPNLVCSAVEPGLVAQSTEPENLAPTYPRVQPDGQQLQLCKSVQGLGSDGTKGRSDRIDDRQPGLVARRLGPLRRFVRAHGLAFGGHLPHRRWPRWGRVWQPKVCAAEQLARQRQSGQSPSPAVADQTKIRRKPVLGRSDDLGGQCGDGIDGLQNLWFWRWPGGCVGAGGRYLLGQRRYLVG